MAAALELALLDWDKIGEHPPQFLIRKRVVSWVKIESYFRRKGIAGLENLSAWAEEYRSIHGSAVDSDIAILSHQPHSNE